MSVLPFGSGKQTNVTGTAANITGTLAVAQGGTGATANTGTGNVVLSTSPTIATPAITGNMTVTGTNQDQGTNLQTIRSETTSDYVASGAVWTISSGLIGAMTVGVVYIGGKRVPVTLITSKTFTASQDTYVSVDNTGTVTYTAVANSAASPALPANSVWLAIVVTNASVITSISPLRGTSNPNVFLSKSGAFTTLTGWGVITVTTAATQFSSTVTFGSVFTRLPIVLITFGGDSTSLATYGSGGNNIEGPMAIKAHTITSSSFIAQIHKPSGANFGANGFAFFQWSATGF